MKLIVLIGVMALVVLGIFAVPSLTQRQSTEQLAREDSAGFFKEKKREADAVKDLVGDGLKAPKPIVKQTDGPSAPSGVHRFENVIENCERAIKNLPTSLLRSRRKPRLAPPGVYFTLTYMSVRKPSGIIGVNAGTRVVCVKDEGAVLIVKAGDLEFEAKRQHLTNNLDVADLAGMDDAEAQQAVESYIAKQQQEIYQHKR
jgi:hypothetical protein